MGNGYVDTAEKMMASGAKDLSQGLTHDELLRGSALSLACRYYTDTIVKDGDLYREMVRDNKVLKPATYTGVLEVAFGFEMFLRGELKKDTEAITEVAMPVEGKKRSQKRSAARP